MKAEMFHAYKHGDFPYPSLWISTVDPTMVVLFTGPKNGTVITKPKSNRYLLGSHSAGFIMAEFVPYSGSVRLEN